ncbi:MAG: hypothetical protein IKS45_04400, partial [Thermoguttaceae bacterium]|nr:hypothetical protein [Thermoguttaceae bacterium]
MKTRLLFRWIIAILLTGFVSIDAVAQSGNSCPIYPVPRSYAATGEKIPLGTDQTAAIVLPASPTTPNRYAAQRLQSLIRNRFKVEIPIAESDAALAESVTQKFVLSVNPAAVTVDGKSKFNGFSIHFTKDCAVSSIVITGADEIGLIALPT